MTDYMHKVSGRPMTAPTLVFIVMVWSYCFVFSLIPFQILPNNYLGVDRQGDGKKTAWFKAAFLAVYLVMGVICSEYKAPACRSSRAWLLRDAGLRGEAIGYI